MSAYDVEIDYTNWRGERRKRVVAPFDIFFGQNEWHKEPGWLLTARDREDGKVKDFAMSGIHSWAALPSTDKRGD